MYGNPSYSAEEHLRTNTFGDGRKSGRGERIRTSGLHVPNVALYQAKLHPVLELELKPNPVRGPVACNGQFGSV